ncbi:MAG: hypothetical protein ACYDCO_27230 [Armatimonadota bacterium]
MTSRRNAKSIPAADEGAATAEGGKVAAEIRRLAQGYGPDALKTLAAIMTDSNSEPSRIAAAREILERAYGKPAAPPAGESTAPAEMVIRYVNDWRESVE